MNPFQKKSLFESVKKHEQKSYFRKIKESFHEKGRRFFVSIAVGIFSICLLSAGIFLFWILKDIPDPEKLKYLTLAETSTIYDSEGKTILYNFHGDENRSYVKLDEISPDVISAILAAEDADFYSHPGVDIMGIFRSFYYLLTNGEFRGGGSTLTQQLVKNTLLTPEQTITRKVREIYLSFRIERAFSKNEILELYLNKISFGNNAYGIEQAARTYFEKSAKDLTMAESVVLAALPQAPSRYSPYGQYREVSLTVPEDFFEKNNIRSESDFYALHSEEFPLYSHGLFGKSFEIGNGENIYIKGRVDTILDQMLEKKFISELEYESTKKELPLVTFTAYKEKILAPHFVFYVRDFLETELAKTLGENTAKDLIEKGGLKIHTTLDIELQKKAEELAQKNAEFNDSFGVTNIAMASAEPKTGYIRTIVGSRDYFLETLNEVPFDGKVNILTQRRQAGSSFKPITYGAAFLAGLSPATILFDVETKFWGPVPPQNFDGTFRGPVSVRKALGNSLNIPALKAGIIAGTGVYDLAQKIGFNLPYNADFYGASIAIGTAEVRPIDMLQAYTVFANNGKKISLIPVLWVEDKEGTVLLDYRERENMEYEQILDEEDAYLVTNILSDPNARGEGWNNRLQLPGRKNAIKTGTSNAVDSKTGKKYPNDLWTIGYTPDLATVVWAGNNRGAILNNAADGYSNAARLWKEFMEAALEGKAVEDFTRPPGIKTIAVDKFSGKLPSPNTPEKFIITEVFNSKNAPTESGDLIKFVDIDRVSGKLPTDQTPTSAIQKRAMLNFHESDPEKYPAWEDGLQKWLSENGNVFIASLGADDFLTSIPTESDDVHSPETAQKKPSVSIVSPINYGLITPPTIDVLPEIAAPNGLKKVVFLWDGEEKKTLIRSPWYTSLDIGNPEKGSSHTLTVRAFDQLYYEDQSEISVKIGTDDAPPTLSFLFPTDNEQISGGGVYTFRVSAVDARSAVKKVIFSLDGKKLETVESLPFVVQWNAPNVSENHVLAAKAFDTSGNIAEQTVHFSILPSSQNSTFGILSPENGAEAHVPISVSAGITPEQAKSLEALEIWARREGGRQEVLQSFAGAAIPSSYTFSATFTEKPGKYEIWAKAKLSSGGNEISKKIIITVL
ncbi:transglycosylase domain-containing protein [Candidatus Peregrinibacteria bacterium]|nr:transglycosylase domain-containing protein [Candidatus Peregrinibacteria bacterium]